MRRLDIIIPVYNEGIDVVRETIAEIQKALPDSSKVTITVVDDGSDPQYNIKGLSTCEGIRFVDHSVNKGYGASLKTGIMEGNGDWIGIIDADGTYPASDLPALVDAADGADMVVGSRTGKISQIPLLRRFPKACLNWLATYMAGSRIDDLNSGMRIFKRPLCYRFWGLLPNRFSFTSTMTMGSLVSGYRVKEVPINYYKRIGSSSIHPIKDTIKFTNIIIKMGMLFYPKKLFDPVAAVLFLVGFSKGFFRDFFTLGYFGNFSILLIIASLQIFLMGYLGELIVTNRKLTMDSYQCKDE